MWFVFMTLLPITDLLCVTVEADTELGTLFDCDDAPPTPQADVTVCLFLLVVHNFSGCMDIIVNS
jgi:hypothetical protein